MTAPTTREELLKYLTEGLKQIQHDRRSADDVAERLLAAIDTFATVCPREPTAQMIGAAMNGLVAKDPPWIVADNLTFDASEFVALGLDPNDQMTLYDAQGVVLRAAYSAGIAASPFAPKEPTDG